MHPLADRLPTDYGPGRRSDGHLPTGYRPGERRWAHLRGVRPGPPALTRELSPGLHSCRDRERRPRPDCFTYRGPRLRSRWAHQLEELRPLRSSRFTWVERQRIHLRSVDDEHAGASAPDQRKAVLSQLFEG